MMGCDPCTRNTALRLIQSHVTYKLVRASKPAGIDPVIELLLKSRYRS